MEFSALLAEERTINVNVGPGEVPITYKPRVTSATYREQMANKTSDEVLADNLTAWGFTSDGKPMPVTLESIKALPEYASLAIWKAISEDQIPNRRASASSGSGS